MRVLGKSSPAETSIDKLTFFFPMAILLLCNIYTEYKSYFITNQQPIYEGIIVAIFLISTVLIFVLPIIVYPTWIAVMYTGILGALGAYLR